MDLGVDCGRLSYPALRGSEVYRNVGLWQDGTYRCGSGISSVRVPDPGQC